MPRIHQIVMLQESKWRVAEWASAVKAATGALSATLLFLTEPSNSQTDAPPRALGIPAILPINARSALPPGAPWVGTSPVRGQSPGSHSAFMFKLVRLP